MPPEQACLHLEQTAIAEPIAEKRMSDFLSEPALEGGNDLLAPRAGERAGASRIDEIAGLDLSVIDNCDRDRVGN